jgi:hypothetical protein
MRIRQAAKVQLSLRSRISFKAVALTAVIFVALAGVASAVGVIPGSDGTITGCYQKANGELRLVADSSDCGRKEQALAWNQQGRPGDRGPQGEPGPRGERGPAGGGVVARAHSTESVVVKAGQSPVDVPLTGATWTQAADETDFIWGRITVDVPDPGQCYGSLVAEIGVDGDFSRGWQASVGGFRSGTQTIDIPAPMNAQPQLFEPGSTTPRELQLRTSVRCGPTGPPGEAPGEWTIRDVRLNAGAWR